MQREPVIMQITGVGYVYLASRLQKIDTFPWRGGSFIRLDPNIGTVNADIVNPTLIVTKDRKLIESDRSTALVSAWPMFVFTRSHLINTSGAGSGYKQVGSCRGSCFGGIPSESPRV